MEHETSGSSKRADSSVESRGGAESSSSRGKAKPSSHEGLNSKKSGANKSNQSARSPADCDAHKGDKKPCESSGVRKSVVSHSAKNKENVPVEVTQGSSKHAGKAAQVYKGKGRDVVVDSEDEEEGEEEDMSTSSGSESDDDSTHVRKECRGSSREGAGGMSSARAQAFRSVSARGVSSSAKKAPRAQNLWAQHLRGREQGRVSACDRDRLIYSKAVPVVQRECFFHFVTHTNIHACLHTYVNA